MKLICITAPDLRKRMRITWRNFSGLDEAGIDGGGITRDFLQELIKSAFDPKLGFFAITPQGAFYPFPQVAQLMDASVAKQHFYFIGRIVGKVSCTKFNGVVSLEMKILNVAGAF